ncbi:MAG: hypothetical protein JOZ41_08530, partial [Chloroflexi bacterium]|nr:hypothetical protein [Chloroflexota bacterium]
MSRATWTIPEPLPFDWTMRDITSARIAVRRLEDGRLEQTIEHAPLPGVTPAMMLWMLANMGREVEWRGRRCILYRCWHPIDHIHFEVLGPFRPGCRFHIVETFLGRPEYLRDFVYNVPRLDRPGFRLELRLLGQLVGSADEEWEEQPDGMVWRVRQITGMAAPLLKTLNPLLLRRSAGMLQAWLLHNVQEDGNLPHVLPELSARYA